MKNYFTKSAKFLIKTHWILTLLTMCFAVVIFSFSSYNLFNFIRANLNFINENGVIALEEGALMQLLELLGNGALSIGAYIVLKACEKTLVESLLK